METIAAVILIFVFFSAVVSSLTEKKETNPGKERDWRVLHRESQRRKFEQAYQGGNTSLWFASAGGCFVLFWVTSSIEVVTAATIGLFFSLWKIGKSLEKRDSPISLIDTPSRYIRSKSLRRLPENIKDWEVDDLIRYVYQIIHTLSPSDRDKVMDMILEILDMEVYGEPSKARKAALKLVRKVNSLSITP